MFAIEVTDCLHKLFIPQWTVCRNWLFLDGWFEELFYSSTAGLGNFFSLTDSLREFLYSLKNHCLRKMWCMELDFLIFSIVFIHKVCDKMSNSNIPYSNEENNIDIGIQVVSSNFRRSHDTCLKLEKGLLATVTRFMSSDIQWPWNYKYKHF